MLLLAPERLRFGTRQHAALCVGLWRSFGTDIRGSRGEQIRTT
jgi:hypothetical protein